jgi:hypothetical protein
MLAEEPEHCGGSIAATVSALWECRAKLAEITDAYDMLLDILSEEKTDARPD